MPLMGADRGVRLVLTVMTACVALLLLATRSLAIAWSMAPAMAVLAVLFCVLPGTILDNGAVPERISVLIALLSVAATDFRPRLASVKLGVPAVLAVIILTQTGSVALAWHQSAAWTDGMRQAMAQVPRGARLLVVQPWNWAQPHHLFLTARQAVPGWYFALNDFPGLMHIAALAAVERGVFFPLLFSHPQKQILSFAPGFGAEQRMPYGVDETLRPDAGAGGPVLQPGFQRFDSMIVLYAELLSVRQRMLLSRLHPTFDNGHIMIVPVR
jgi:hypothetical protein